MIVMDASAALEYLLDTDAGREVSRLMASRAPTVHSPHLIDLEVTSAVRRLVLKGAVDADRGQQAIEQMAGLDIQRYSHQTLLPRVWALRANLSAYDASYVALAEALDAPLFTCDAKLAASSAGTAEIQMVESPS